MQEWRYYPQSFEHDEKVQTQLGYMHGRQVAPRIYTWILDEAEEEEQRSA